ncbi:hypothetical protein [Frigoribacterium faeni]|uniref:DNA polymerase III subunit gamma/tau n=1 Tax=Frigoribacterium faeni TaxID=145483 RepID=A0A7W3JGD8_9MICO|nr:hypothetical protein [Frigoribacterium faeni]MBA8812361.1 hypothetical protein [Frigoribacterium faeni]BFF13423.1 hypothetical protein GCM10025699_47260 [Microbacterium flavescens]GEK84540.1 hypothetical protein FFA01_28490 [Frigoribacterium faeni]
MTPRGPSATDPDETDHGRPDVASAVGDDDALSWGDERDASHVDGPPRASLRVDASDATEDDGEQASGSMSSASLVAHGVLGGVFLLSTVGWIALSARFAYTFSTVVATGLWRLGVILAIVAPLLWFLSSIVLVPASRGRRRIMVMVIGALVVAPWPLLIGVGA